MLPSQIKLPFFYRITEIVGSQLNGIGVDFPKLEMDAIQDLARTLTGLEDFGDPYINAGLDVLLDSLKKEANLNFVGRLTAWEILVHYFIQRLFFVDAQKRRPEKFGSTLKPPFVVTGLHRSGTTFLHRLLALDPENVGIPFWQLYRPFPGLTRLDLRKTLTRAELALTRPFYPGLNYKHGIRTSLPEECIWLQGVTFRSLIYWVLLPVQEYANWLLSQNRERDYHEYAQMIYYLQFDSEKHPVLKAPDHMANIEILLTEFPGAQIIQLQRDPITCLTSLNSLVYSTHSTLTNDIAPKVIGDCNLKIMTHHLRKNANARLFPAVNDRILDVQFTDLITDPIMVIRRIYTHFNQTWSGDYEVVLRGFLENRHRANGVTHQYQPEQFGQTDESLQEAFAAFV